MRNNTNHYQLLNIGSTNAKYFEIFNNKKTQYIFPASNQIELNNILKNKTSSHSLIINTQPELLDNNLYTKTWDTIDLEYIVHNVHIRNIYDKFGQDRIINIFGAMNLNINKAFIIDFGTYTTCTAFEFHNHYYEVTYNSIAPGISSQLRDINKDNNNLPLYTEEEFIKHNTDNIFFNKTKQALHHGIVLQNIHFINYLQQKYNDYEFIITGGWSDIVNLHCNNILHKPNLWINGAQEYLSLIK